jgi:hypothetical protein
MVEGSEADNQPMNLDAIRPEPEPAAPATEPQGRRATRDPATLLLLAALTIPGLLFIWHEVEPSLTFRPVPAVVVGADLAHVRLRGRYGSSTYSSPEVFYRYVVAGVPYMGRKYQRTDLSLTDLPAEETVREFSGKRDVQAWYNPLHPDEAVLTRTPNVPLLACTLFLLLAIWARAYTLRVTGPPRIELTAPLG